MVLEHLSEQEEEHLLEQKGKHLPMQEGVVWLQLDQRKQVASLLLKQEQKQQEVKTRCSKEKLHQDERREGFLGKIGRSSHSSRCSSCLGCLVQGSSGTALGFSSCTSVTRLAAASCSRITWR